MRTVGDRPLPSGSQHVWHRITGAMVLASGYVAALLLLEWLTR